MSSVTMKIIKGIAFGMVIGSALGAGAACAMKPKKRRFKRCASHALDSVGEMMQNIADYVF